MTSTHVKLQNITIKNFEKTYILKYNILRVSKIKRNIGWQNGDITQPASDGGSYSFSNVSIGNRTIS